MTLTGPFRLTGNRDREKRRPPRERAQKIAHRADLNQGSGNNSPIYCTWMPPKPPKYTYVFSMKDPHESRTRIE